MGLACMGKSGNLLAVLEIAEFVKFLFESVSSFGELLFLITEMIRYEFPAALDRINKKISQRDYKTK